MAVYPRREMPETLDHGHAASSGGVPPTLAAHRGLIVMSVLAVLGGTVSTYVGNYMTTYAITTLKFAPTMAMAATVVGGLSTVVFSLLGGWLSDRLGRKPVMLIPRLLAALLSYPAFLFLVDQKTPLAFFGVTILLGALTALSGAASLVAIPELFPRRIRCYVPI